VRDARAAGADFVKTSQVSPSAVRQRPMSRDNGRVVGPGWALRPRVAFAIWRVHGDDRRRRDAYRYDERLAIVRQARLARERLRPRHLRLDCARPDLPRPVAMPVIVGTRQCSSMARKGTVASPAETRGL